MKVLIADDEISICRLIKHLGDWESLGMEVIGFAHDGEAALSMMRANCPDIVITDIRMPGFNGLEVISQIKKEMRGMDFVVVSGFRQFEYAQEALRQGVSNFLLKPISGTELNHTLEKIRQRRSQKHEQLGRDLRLKEIEQKEKWRRKKEFILAEVVGASAPWDAKDINEAFHYQFKPGFFQLAMLKFDGLLVFGGDSAHFHDKVERLLAECLEGVHDYGYAYQQGCYYLALNYPQGMEIKPRLKAILESLREDSDVFKGFFATIGLGKKAADAAGLFDVPGALQSLGQRLVLGQSQVIDYQPLAVKEEIALGPFSNGLLAAIEKNGMDALKSLLDGLKETAFSGSPTGNQILKLAEDVLDLYLLGLKKYAFQHSQKGLSREGLLWEIDQQGNAKKVLDHLCQSITQDFSRILKAVGSAGRKPITQAKKYIENNYHAPITLEQLSQEVGFSTAYFGTLFKQETGESFTEYLFRIRMEEAKRMLRDTDDAVSQICQGVGYSDPKHFNKGFKKMTGLTPREYRKLYA